MDVEAAKEQVQQIDENEAKMAKLEKLIGENNGVYIHTYIHTYMNTFNICVYMYIYTFDIHVYIYIFYV